MSAPIPATEHARAPICRCSHTTRRSLPPPPCKRAASSAVTPSAAGGRCRTAGESVAPLGGQVVWSRLASHWRLLLPSRAPDTRRLGLAESPLSLPPRHPPLPGTRRQRLHCQRPGAAARLSLCVRACVAWSDERRRSGGVSFGDGRGGRAGSLEDAGEDRAVCGCVPVERGGALRPATSPHPSELLMRCPVCPSSAPPRSLRVCVCETARVPLHA